MYDLTTARKNPYAEKLKDGYSIRVHIPSVEQREKEMSDFFVTDEELKMLKEFVRAEEENRILKDAL